MKTMTSMRNKKLELHLRIKSLAPSISSTVLLVRDSWVPLQETTMALTKMIRTKDSLGGVAISREGYGDTDQSSSGIKRPDW